MWSGHAALRHSTGRHSTGPGRRTSSSSAPPAWRRRYRRAQDHQRRSLAAGEIQAAGAAGAIKNPLPQSASSTRGRGECPHDLECCACKSSRESAVGRAWPSRSRRKCRSFTPRWGRSRVPASTCRAVPRRELLSRRPCGADCRYGVPRRGWSEEPMAPAR